MIAPKKTIGIRRRSSLITCCSSSAACTRFAWGQWGAIDAQAKSAERTFTLTQRAEITLGRPDGTLAEIIEPKVGEPLRAKIFLTNSGRTAAREFRAKEAIGIGDRPSTMDLGSEPVLKHATVRGGFTAQSGPITSTIASGGVFTHIARSAESLTEEDADKIKARQLWIRIMGRYEYNDGVGSDEWRAYFLDFDPTVGIFVATDMPLRRDTWSYFKIPTCHVAQDRRGSQHYVSGAW